MAICQMNSVRYDIIVEPMQLRKADLAGDYAGVEAEKKRRGRLDPEHTVSILPALLRVLNII